VPQAGAQAGEVASKTAAEAFDRDLPAGAPEQFLRETIEEANRRIHELARADPSKAGMGTTITAAIVDAQGEEVGIGHVGDSRAYRWRRGKLERLTRDHSLVEEMRRKGQITDAQAEDHPQRSIITRALGPEPDVEVDLQTVPASPGDVFLLCSDGLTTMVGEERIGAVLSAAGSMREAVRTLVDEANGAGGRDNITAMAFRLADASAPLGESTGDATLVGATAEEAGLTGTEVRRRAAAAAARERREKQTAKPPRRRLRCGVPAKQDLRFFADSEAEQLFDAAVRRVQHLGEVIEIDFAPFRAAAELQFVQPFFQIIQPQQDAAILVEQLPAKPAAGKDCKPHEFYGWDHGPAQKKPQSSMQYW